MRKRKRRRHRGCREFSSPPLSGAPTAGLRLQEKPDLGLSTADWSLLGAPMESELKEFHGEPA